MNNSLNIGNEKTANLLNLLESVQPVIPDELILDVAETIVSLFKINEETSFLIGAVAEEMIQIAHRYAPYSGSHSYSVEEFVERQKTAASK
mgnify:CR=1 FL=1